MLHQVIYSSRATRAMGVEDLRAILEDARGGNERREVTGALIYADGAFLQVLEGPKDTVMNLLGSIAADTRHTDVRVFHSAEVDHRVFAAWQMAYMGGTVEQLSGWLGLPGASSIQQIAEELGRDSTRASEVAVRLLRALGA